VRHLFGRRGTLALEFGERFWRTLKEDLIEETDFDSLEELEDELLKYLVYYNWERPHQGINGKKPIEMITLNNKNKS
jgi:transposase InsO family protein